MVWHFVLLLFDLCYLLSYKYFVHFLFRWLKALRGRPELKAVFVGHPMRGPLSSFFCSWCSFAAQALCVLPGNGWLCLDTGSRHSFPPCPFPPALKRWEVYAHAYTHTQMHRHLAHRLEQLLAVTKHHVCILRKTLAFRIQLASEYTQMVFMF